MRPGDGGWGVLYLGLLGVGVWMFTDWACAADPQRAYASPFLTIAETERVRALLSETEERRETLALREGAGAAAMTRPAGGAPEVAPAPVFTDANLDAPTYIDGLPADAFAFLLHQADEFLGIEICGGCDQRERLCLLRRTCERDESGWLVSGMPNPGDVGLDTDPKAELDPEALAALRHLALHPGAQEFIAAARLRYREVQARLRLLKGAELAEAERAEYARSREMLRPLWALDETLARIAREDDKAEALEAEEEKR